MPPRSNQQRPELLAALAINQDRVVSRRQLRTLGYNADAVSRRIESDRWSSFGSAVVLHKVELSPRQRQWVAILNAPGLAAITGRAAAESLGLRGFRYHLIDVLVPIGDRPADLAGVHWRRCGGFSDLALTSVRGLPTALAARSVTDAASWTTEPRIACALVAAAVQQRVTTASSLRLEVARRPNAQHRGILGLILADIDCGADSLAEIDLTRLARKAGLAPPIRQSVRFDSQGRRRYLDADFGTFVVEIDGGLHLQAETYWADAKRQNEIVLGGDRVLRFATIALRLDEDTVVAQLRRAKAVFG